jgi:2-hydroxychromene-2-carboxylate isomerase
MRKATWYFDFVSPYSYLCLHRLTELPPDLTLEYKPVLFAGLLGAWGQKGPAEIPAKRRWTYRSCQWWADAHGIPFRFPATHPFNPLHHLRLVIACGVTPESVRTVFDALWTSGGDAAEQARFVALARSLGINDVDRLAAPDVKDTLRTNTEEAAALGVFGVPTFAMHGELFWGNDAIDFFNAWLANPGVLETAEMRRIDSLPIGATRKF